jgi:predicted house-cleaning noncanonical NTP pyrophosphatase (MazG superfamily)
MTQELIDLRNSILEGRYADALAIVDELDWMSKKATLRNIKSFLLRMLIHLIKNQIEQRLTNSWAAAIRDSIIEIQDLNLQENKTSHYIKQDEWEQMLTKTLEAAIRTASVEVMNGKLSPFQLLELVDRSQIIQVARRLLAMTYEDSAEILPATVDEYLTQLPGGEDWKEGKQ